MNNEIAKLIEQVKSNSGAARSNPDNILGRAIIILANDLEHITNKHNLLECKITAPSIEKGDEVIVWNIHRPDEKLTLIAAGTVDEYGDIEVFDEGDGERDTGISSYEQFRLVDED